MSKKHKHKRNAQQDQTDKRAEQLNQKHEEFVNLYQADGEDGAIDMTTLDQTSGRKPAVATAIVVILVLSAVAAALGYFVFGQHQLTVSPGDVTLTVSSVDSLASGDQITLKLHYVNHSPTSIDHGTVELLAPTGFYITSSDPAASSIGQHDWNVTSVPAGAEGTITVVGQLVGQKGDQKTFTSLFTYTPTNFNSDFQASSTKIIALTDSILGLDVNVADHARTEDELQYVLTLKNNSTLPLINAKAVITFPSGFDPKSSDPVATQSNQTWIFPQINPGDSQVVKIKGDVTADNGASLEFVLQAGLQEPDGNFTVEAEDHHTVTVLNPDLNLTMTAPTSAQAGDKLAYAITITNPAQVDLKNIVLKLAFTADAVNSSDVTLDTIKELKAGDNKTITYTAVVNSPLPTDLTTIHAKLSVDSAAIADTDVTFDTTAETDTAVQGALSISAAGRYYDDDLTKIGSGPTPPAVGQTTTYVVRWTVVASGDDMSDVTLQTTLPDSATYVSSSASNNDGRIAYDASTRTVTFTLRSLSRDDSKTADFKVSITPTATDVNKLMVLANDTVATGTDKNSNVAIQAQAKKVTTKLDSDPAATDDGVVIL